MSIDRSAELELAIDEKVLLVNRLCQAFVFTLTVCSVCTVVGLITFDSGWLSSVCWSGGAAAMFAAWTKYEDERLFGLIQAGEDVD